MLHGSSYAIQGIALAPIDVFPCWFRIPELGDRNSYVAAIEALPLVQTPEVFGLHANADISYYTSATKALWRNLVRLLCRARTHVSA